MRKRNHVVRVHLDDKELAHLQTCLSKTDWNQEAFLRSAIMGTGIATNPPEDCREIIERLREIGDKLGGVPTAVTNLTTEERRQIQEATTAIWQVLLIVQDAFLPPHKYHMTTAIQKEKNV